MFRKSIMNEKSIKRQIEDSIKTKETLIKNGLVNIKEAAELLIQSITSSGKILWCGNGGSAADAQHLATELMGGMADHDRMPIPSIALTTDSSFITAWTNDFGYVDVFSRQVETLGNAGDLLMCYTTSGTSPNIVSAAKMAKQKGLKVILFTGENTNIEIKKYCDFIFHAPSSNTAYIQEAHTIIGHEVCLAVEIALANK